MKKQRVLAMVLAASMIFSQSVFAAEPAATPGEAAVETAQDQTSGTLETEHQEQTYDTLLKSSYIIYVGYPVIGEEDYAPDFTISFADESICTGSMEITEPLTWKKYITLEGLKEGTTTLTLTNSDGTVYRTVEITVKAELPEDAVPINDVVLRSCLVDDPYYGDMWDDGYISYEEMKEIENLSISSRGTAKAEDISALQYATNLTYLSLEGADVTDISVLSNMENLKSLYLAGTNVTSIQPLYGLENLYNLTVPEQIPEEERLEIICLRNKKDSMVKGEKVYFPAACYGVIEGTFSVKVSGGEAGCMSVEEPDPNSYSWSQRYSLLAEEKGTAELTLTLNGVEKKFTVNIDGIPAEQEVEETVGCKIENYSMWGEENPTAAILSANGKLWKTYPEAKEVRSNAVKYVSDWVYSGEDTVICDYSLDESGVLWSEDTKLAENIKDMSGHYALTEDNVLMDIYNTDSKQIEDVKDWIEIRIYYNDNYDTNGVYVLKNDGSLWTREEVGKEETASEFTKVADGVVQITDSGYLLENGDYYYYGEKEASRSNVESIYGNYYYGTDGNCYVESGAEDVNIGNYRLQNCIRTSKDKDSYGYVAYCLTEDGRLLYVADGTMKMLSEKVSEIWKYDVCSSRNSMRGIICKADDGTCYRVVNDTMTETTGMKVIYLCDNEGWDDHNNPFELIINKGETSGIAERNGIPVLNCVKQIWSDFSGVYALRTDGTIWKIDQIPELYITLGNTMQTGDLTGDDKIDIRDLMMCLYHVSGRNTVEGDALTAADINGDGKVDILDLMRILYYVSGRNETL